MAWTTILSDTFTGSNGTTLPAHDSSYTTRFGTPELQSNTFADGNGGSGSRAEINISTEDDQALACDIVDAAGSAGILIVRHEHTGATDVGFNGYGVVLSAGIIASLDRYDAGVATNLDSIFAFPAYSTGQTLRIEIEGSAISVLLDDVEILSATDATYSSGSLAAIAYDDGGAWDNLLAQHVVVIKGPWELEAVQIFVPGFEDIQVRTLSGVY